MVKINKKLIFSVKILITLVILYLLITKIEFSSLIAAFTQIKPKYFWFSVALLPANFFWQIAKWHYLVKLVEPKVTWWESAVSLLGGYSAMLISPGRAGELARSLFFYGRNKVKLAGLVIIDKLFAFLAILFFASFGFFLSNMMLIIFFFSAVAFIVIIIVNPIIFKKFKMLSARFLKHDIYDDFNRKQLFITFLYSGIFFVTYAIQYFWLINAFEEVGILVWIKAFPATMLINTFSFTIGGLGIREGAAVYFFSKYGGVAAASAMNASLMLYTINVLTPGILGCFTLSRIKFREAEKESL